MTDPKHLETKEIVLVRIYGHKTEIFIDRKQELRNMTLLSELSLCPQLYGSFNNGFVYGYSPGIPYVAEDFSNFDKARLVAKKVAEFHGVMIEGKKESRYFKTIKGWIKHVPLRYDNPKIQHEFQTLIDMEWLTQQVFKNELVY